MAVVCETEPEPRERTPKANADAVPACHDESCRDEDGKQPIQPLKVSVEKAKQPRYMPRPAVVWKGKYQTRNNDRNHVGSPSRRQNPASNPSMKQSRKGGIIAWRKEQGRASGRETMHAGREDEMRNDDEDDASGPLSQTFARYYHANKKMPPCRDCHLWSDEDSPQKATDRGGMPGWCTAKDVAPRNVKIVKCSASRNR